MAFSTVPPSPPLQVTPTSLVLHYYSQRQGLSPWVEGIVDEVATTMFGVQISMETMRSRKQGTSDHEVRAGPSVVSACLLLQSYGANLCSTIFECAYGRCTVSASRQLPAPPGALRRRPSWGLSAASWDSTPRPSTSCSLSVSACAG